MSSQKKNWVKRLLAAASGAVRDFDVSELSAGTTQIEHEHQQRWRELAERYGWQIVSLQELRLAESECERAVRRAMDSANSHNGDWYSTRNDRLHDLIKEASQAAFRQTPLPAASDVPRFDYFTYQNYDYFAENGECCVVVRKEFLSAAVLKRYQQLLIGDFEDWCIVVTLSVGEDLAGENNIFVYATRVLIPETTTFDTPPIDDAEAGPSELRA